MQKPSSASTLGGFEGVARTCSLHSRHPPSLRQSLFVSPYAIHAKDEGGQVREVSPGGAVQRFWHSHPVHLAAVSSSVADECPVGWLFVTRSARSHFWRPGQLAGTSGSASNTAASILSSTRRRRLCPTIHTRTCRFQSAVGDGSASSLIPPRLWPGDQLRARAPKTRRRRRRRRRHAPEVRLQQRLTTDVAKRQ